MSYLWDYPVKKLKSIRSGKAKILERMINYGTTEKIKLSEVKNAWTKLHLFPRKKRLFELLISGK